jgi:hypothetical protein
MILSKCSTLNNPAFDKPPPSRTRIVNQPLRNRGAGKNFILMRRKAGMVAIMQYQRASEIFPFQFQNNSFILR